MKQYIVDSSIITVILCSLVLGVYSIKGLYPFGNDLILWGDMVDQGVPYLYRAYDVLTGTESPDFSWSIAAGIPLNYSFTPFHLLLLLTDRENIYRFASIIILARMLAMALAMYAFTCRYSIHRGWKIICSLLYGMGPCALIYYQIEYVMLDIAVLFPLLMIGFYSLLERGNALLYIVILAISIGHKMYVSYMVLLYLFSISILYFYFKVERKDFWDKCSNLTLSTLIAIGISAFMWMPDWNIIANSSRLEHGTHGGWFSTYLRAMETIPIFDSDHFISCYCFLLGSGLLIAAILYAWKHLNGELRYHRFQLLLICLAVFIPGTELLWHGGSRTLWPARFIFIFTFVLIEIFLVITEHHFLELSRKVRSGEKTKLLLAILGIAALAAFSLKYYTADVTLAWIPLTTALYLYILMADIPWKTQLLTTVLVLDIAYSGFLWIAPCSPKQNEESDIQPEKYRYEELVKYRYFYVPALNLRNELYSEEKGPFLRIRDYYSYFGPNYAMVLGNSSISNGIGSVPRNLIQYYDSLGYIDMVGTDQHMDEMIDTGGTAFTDAMLYIRSVFTVDTPLNSKLYQLDDSISAVHLYRHRYTLPVGIELSGTAMPDENVFSYQNNLFRAITGREDALIHEWEGTGAHLEIQVTGKHELYFYSDSKDTIYSISVNGCEISIPNRFSLKNREYPVKYNSRMMDLGTFENETVKIDFATEHDYDFSQIHIGLLDIQTMSEAFEELQVKNTVSSWETGSNFVQLECTSSAGGTLFLPIWHSKGWQCEVNGKSSELETVLGGWIGVPLEQGSNRIWLRFQPKPHWPSIFLTLASLVAGIFAFRLSRNSKNRYLWTRLGHIIGSIYLLLAVIFLIFIYLLPIPLGLWYTFTS